MINLSVQSKSLELVTNMLPGLDLAAYIRIERSVFVFVRVRSALATSQITIVIKERIYIN